LWQLDLSSVWVAEHGWCYLNAIIDCCTREIVAWQTPITPSSCCVAPV
jgi:transposase InsO family protein